MKLILKTNEIFFLDLQAGVDKDRDTNSQCEDKGEAFIEGLLLLPSTLMCWSIIMVIFQQLEWTGAWTNNFTSTSNRVLCHLTGALLWKNPCLISISHREGRSLAFFFCLSTVSNDTYLSNITWSKLSAWLFSSPGTHICAYISQFIFFHCSILRHSPYGPYHIFVAIKLRQYELSKEGCCMPASGCSESQGAYTILAILKINNHSTSLDLQGCDIVLFPRNA